MRPAPQWGMRLLLGGLAAVGIVAAHAVAYVAAVPDPHGRLVVLHDTGHQQWTFVIAIAVGVLIVAAARFMVGSLTGARKAAAPLGAPYASTAARLAGLQVAGFLILESVERASVHESVAHVVTEPAVLIGIALQVLVALVGAALLLVFTKALAVILARRGQGHTRSAPVERPVREFSGPRFAVATGGATLRGPPLSV